jgi:hypothetical protein
MERRFRALLVHGPYPVVHGFLAGFLTGKGIAGTIYYCEKEKIDVDFGVDEGLAERLADWVGLHKYFTTPIVVEESIHGPVLDALKGARAELRLDVEVSRAVREATMEVRVRTFSEEEAVAVRRLVENPPAGVLALPGWRLEEERRETAHGIEAYAPEHEFELAGSGTFAGRVDLVLDYRKKLAENPLIHCGHIRLDLE